MANKLSLETKKKWFQEVKETLEGAVVVGAKMRFAQPDANTSLLSLVFEKLENFANLYLETQDALDRQREQQYKARKTRAKTQTPLEIEQVENLVESEAEIDN